MNAAKDSIMTYSGHLDWQALVQCRSIVPDMSYNERKNLTKFISSYYGQRKENYGFNF